MSAMQKQSPKFPFYWTRFRTACSRVTRQVARFDLIKPSNVLSILATIVAIASAAFSYLQTNAAKSQLQLAELQIRPYLKYIPAFSIERADHLVITMISENLGPVPGRIIYDQLTTWVDGVSGGAFLFNKTGDILYQHKGGGTVLPEMPRAMERAVIHAQSELLIGTCVVYGSISSSDLRRWEVRALYSFAPNSDLPETEYVREVEVMASTEYCDSRTIRSEWLVARGH